MAGVGDTVSALGVFHSNSDVASKTLMISPNALILPSSQNKS